MDSQWPDCGAADSSCEYWDKLATSALHLLYKNVYFLIIINCLVMIIYVSLNRESSGRRWVFLPKANSVSSLKRLSTWWSVWVADDLKRAVLQGVAEQFLSVYSAAFKYQWMNLVICKVLTVDMSTGKPAGVLQRPAAVHSGRLREISVPKHSEAAAVSGTTVAPTHALEG